jgi:hypothetical protein
MKIKNVLLTLVCVGAALSSFAQTSDAEAEAVARLLGVQKKEAVAQLVSVAQKDSAVFWKLYDEYIQSNIADGKERIKLFEETALSYATMTPETADALANRYFKLRVKQEKSLEEYYKKIKAATNATNAFQFYQAEIYMLTLMRGTIMQQIPTFGEVLKASKKN